jgi:hypothetical protein
MKVKNKFDINEFVDVTIPVILHDRKDYYVKGGKAYDTYFLDKTNSIDWDLVGTKEFNFFLKNTMEKYAKSMGLVVNSRNSDFDGTPMIQYGFEGYEVEKNDPFFLDVLIVFEIKSDNYCTINNVNYMNIVYFVADLILTTEDRHTKATNYNKSITGGSDSFVDLYNFNKRYNEKFSLEIGLPKLKQLTVTLFTNYINTKKLNEVTYKILKELYVDKLKRLDDITWIKYMEIINEDSRDVLDNMEGKISSEKFKESEDQLSDIEPFFSTFSSDVAGSIYAYQKTKAESETTFLKYHKTVKRLKNIINISWSNLSKDFKKYLLIKCEKTGQSTKLFNMSPTCQATVECNNKHIVLKKNTDNCIDEIKLKLKV